MGVQTTFKELAYYYGGGLSTPFKLITELLPQNAGWTTELQHESQGDFSHV